MNPQTRKNMGYERHYSNLWNRNVAYHRIYLKYRHEFQLPFDNYEVHHIDMDKHNNREENLAILTPKQHTDVHILIDEVRKIIGGSEDIQGNYRGTILSKKEYLLEICENALHEVLKIE